MSLQNVLKKYQERISTVSSQVKSVKTDSPVFDSFEDFELGDFDDSSMLGLAQNSPSKSNPPTIKANTFTESIDENLLDFEFELGDIEISSYSKNGIKQADSFDANISLDSAKTQPKPPTQYYENSLPKSNHTQAFSESSKNVRAVLNMDIIDELGDEFDLENLHQIFDESGSQDKTPNIKSAELYANSSFCATPVTKPVSRDLNSQNNDITSNHLSKSFCSLSKQNLSSIKRKKLNENSTADVSFITPNNKNDKSSLENKNCSVSTKGIQKIEKQQTVTSIIKSVNRTLFSSDRGLPGPAGALGNPLGVYAERDEQSQSSHRGALSQESWTHTTGRFTDQDFDSITWTTLLSEYDIEEYKPSMLPRINRDSIYLEWYIKRVSEIDQPRLIPYLLALVSEYSSTESDASATLIDPTGEIAASIHNGFFAVKGNHIAIGSAILLKNVPVMISRDNQCYLVMTANTTEKVFTPNYYVQDSFKKLPIYLSESQL